MPDITIPPAALEAGAITLCSRAGYAWTVTPDVHDHWRAEARAAFFAMLAAWPDRHTKLFACGQHHIILPLTQENSDEH